MSEMAEAGPSIASIALTGKTFPHHTEFGGKAMKVNEIFSVVRLGLTKRCIKEVRFNFWHSTFVMGTCLVANRCTSPSRGCGVIDSQMVTNNCGVGR